jgi:hypothetical protein
LIKILTFRMVRVILWRESQTKAIPCEPWKHVEMDVEDLLHRRLAVRQQQVNPFAPHAALTNSRGHALSDAHYGCGCLGIDVREERSVPNRDDENVPSINGLDIHESGDSLVAKHEAAGNVTREDAAEDAVSHESSGIVLPYNAQVQLQAHQ